MNRELKRQLALRVKKLREENKSFGQTMTPVDRDKWPDLPITQPVCVFRSRDFLAMLYTDTDGFGAMRLSVCKTDVQSDGAWKQDIRWEELMRIKAECGYASHCAYEVYPSERDVVNVANMRHLWILPLGQKMGWRS